MVGGAPALDFVNTTGSRLSGKPRERLRTYQDLVLWSTRAGVLDESIARALRSQGDRDAPAAEGVLHRARKLREDVYAVLCPTALGAEPSMAAVQRLDGWFSQACDVRTLTVTDGKVVWSWTSTQPQLDTMLWPIVESVETLLDVGNLKKCGECDWLFLDESKNQSREWCKKLCGDRVRARRYYESSKER